ncbi:histidine phosphatase family protein [Bacillus sp. M6-12]|uniref:histidine phosphatase family protein n=1 Tax=Bacillus sp. M6-12 TaxID=2054166 RepID=UPI000C77F0F0|nr:histidine phosphatase family protein [Bacillus sp. M6-12]PLS15349.1 histidine phosphatase family protein [Bacillus sp. M6-12]
MKTLYMIRHAKAEGQPPKSHLTNEGVKQAQVLAEFFLDKKVDRIFSSPFVRAVDTACPLSILKGVAIEQDWRLSERFMSASDMDNWQELLKRTFDDLDLLFDGGETNRDGMKRASEFLNDILFLESEDIVIVSHGNLITLLLRLFDESYGFETLMKLSNPDVFQVLISDGNHEVTRIWED